MKLDIVRRFLTTLILGLASAVVFAFDTKKILILGDSLSSEYGLPRSTGWVHLLTQRLAAENFRAVVINSSISGETSAGGLSRLPGLLAQHKPSIVVIELGGNDALRGLALAHTKYNFLKLTQLSSAAGSKVLLLGMQVPPNMGAAYAKEFAALYQYVAKSSKASLVPFFLKNVADAAASQALFQADGIHPIAAAQPAMLANVWPELKKLLQ